MRWTMRHTGIELIDLYAPRVKSTRVYGSIIGTHFNVEARVFKLIIGGMSLSMEPENIFHAELLSPR